MLGVIAGLCSRRLPLASQLVRWRLRAGVAKEDLVYICTKIARQMDAQGFRVSGVSEARIQGSRVCFDPRSVRTRPSS